ncbi:FAD-dependent oxidoreductase [Nocardia sp. NBC_00881]|uniref:FAD-dependent oxidoreductase n=1 Tax=Nocardia sp. NBC_00881 TaxID=2975995 RepID=UPI00386A7293|nr:FAD-dependent oxidoreductase [Nocardia sp. NBC_00881]
MSIVFPEWASYIVGPLEFLVGEWPEADEDLLWELGRVLSEVGRDWAEHSAELQRLMDKTLAAYPEGKAPGEIGNFFDDLQKALADLSGDAVMLAESANQFGNDVQEAKLYDILGVFELVGGVLAARAMGPGAPYAEAMARVKALTWFLRVGELLESRIVLVIQRLIPALRSPFSRKVANDLLKLAREGADHDDKLLSKFIRKEAREQAAANADPLAQLIAKGIVEIPDEALEEFGQEALQGSIVGAIQADNPGKGGFDWGKFWQNQAIAAIAGGFAGPVGTATAVPFGRAFQKGGWAGAGAGAVVGGTAGLAGVGGGLLGGRWVTGEWSEIDPYMFTSGIAGGIGPSMIHGFRGAHEYDGFTGGPDIAPTPPAAGDASSPSGGGASPGSGGPSDPVCAPSAGPDGSRGGGGAAAVVGEPGADVAARPAKSEDPANTEWADADSDSTRVGRPLVGVSADASKADEGLDGDRTAEGETVFSAAGGGPLGSNGQGTSSFWEALFVGLGREDPRWDAVFENLGRDDSSWEEGYDGGEDSRPGNDGQGSKPGDHSDEPSEAHVAPPVDGFNEAKQIYRSLSKEAHPDRTSGLPSEQQQFCANIQQRINDVFSSITAAKTSGRRVDLSELLALQQEWNNRPWAETDSSALPEPNAPDETRDTVSGSRAATATAESTTATEGSVVAGYADRPAPSPASADEELSVSAENSSEFQQSADSEPVLAGDAATLEQVESNPQTGRADQPTGVSADADASRSDQDSAATEAAAASAESTDGPTAHTGRSAEVSPHAVSATSYKMVDPEPLEERSAEGAAHTLQALGIGATRLNIKKVDDDQAALDETVESAEMAVNAVDAAQLARVGVGGEASVAGPGRSSLAGPGSETGSAASSSQPDMPGGGRDRSQVDSGGSDGSLPQRDGTGGTSTGAGGSALPRGSLGGHSGGIPTERGPRLPRHGAGMHPERPGAPADPPRGPNSIGGSDADRPAEPPNGSTSIAGTASAEKVSVRDGTHHHHAASPTSDSGWPNWLNRLVPHGGAQAGPPPDRAAEPSRERGSRFGREDTGGVSEPGSANVENNSAPTPGEGQTRPGTPGGSELAASWDEYTRAEAELHAVKAAMDAEDAEKSPPSDHVHFFSPHERHLLHTAGMAKRRLDEAVRVLRERFGVDPTDLVPDQEPTPKTPKTVLASGFGPRTEAERSVHIREDLGSVAAVSDMGRRHKRDEDAMAFAVVHLEGKPVVISVVCDGVSKSTDGHQAARVAAAAAAGYLERAVAEAGRDGSFDRVAVMKGAIDAAQQAVVELTQRDYPRTDRPPACTIGASLLESGRITVGWVGDSRVYWLAGTNGESRLLTRDHTVVPMLVDRGTPERVALKSPFAHVISHCLGVKGSVPDAVDDYIRTEPISGSGSVLTCTDGMWNDLPEAERLAGLVQRNGSDLGGALAALTSQALSSGGHDNITGVLAQHPPAEPRTRSVHAAAKVPPKNLIAVGRAKVPAVGRAEVQVPRDHGAPDHPRGGTQGDPNGMAESADVPVGLDGTPPDRGTARGGNDIGLGLDHPPGGGESGSATDGDSRSDRSLVTETADIATNGDSQVPGSSAGQRGSPGAPRDDRQGDLNAGLDRNNSDDGPMSGPAGGSGVASDDVSGGGDGLIGPPEPDGPGSSPPGDSGSSVDGAEFRGASQTPFPEPRGERVVWYHRLAQGLRALIDDSIAVVVPSISAAGGSPPEPGAADQWVAAARAGDYEALCRLRERYGDTVTSKVASAVGDHGTAETIRSLVRETFLRATRAITPHVDIPDDVGTWLVGVAGEVVSERGRIIRFKRELWRMRTAGGDGAASALEKQLLASATRPMLLRCLYRLPSAEADWILRRTGQLPTAGVVARRGAESSGNLDSRAVGHLFDLLTDDAAQVSGARSRKSTEIIIDALLADPERAERYIRRLPPALRANVEQQFLQGLSVAPGGTAENRLAEWLSGRAMPGGREWSTAVRAYLNAPETVLSRLAELGLEDQDSLRPWLLRDRASTPAADAVVRAVRELIESVAVRAAAAETAAPVAERMRPQPPSKGNYSGEIRTVWDNDRERFWGWFAELRPLEQQVIRWTVLAARQPTKAEMAAEWGMSEIAPVRRKKSVDRLFAGWLAGGDVAGRTAVESVSTARTEYPDRFSRCFASLSDDERECLRRQVFGTFSTAETAETMHQTEEQIAHLRSSAVYRLALRIRIDSIDGVGDKKAVSEALARKAGLTQLMVALALDGVEPVRPDVVRRVWDALVELEHTRAPRSDASGADSPGDPHSSDESGRGAGRETPESNPDLPAVPGSADEVTDAEVGGTSLSPIAAADRVGSAASGVVRDGEPADGDTDDGRSGVVGPASIEGPAPEGVGSIEMTSDDLDRWSAAELQFALDEPGSGAALSGGARRETLVSVRITAGDREGPGKARAAAGPLLVEACPPDMLDAANTLITELTTNGLEHAKGGEVMVTVETFRTPDHRLGVQVEVFDTVSAEDVTFTESKGQRKGAPPGDSMSTGQMGLARVLRTFAGFGWMEHRDPGLPFPVEGRDYGVTELPNSEAGRSKNDEAVWRKKVWFRMYGPVSDSVESEDRAPSDSVASTGTVASESFSPVEPESSDKRSPVQPEGRRYYADVGRNIGVPERSPAERAVGQVRNPGKPGAVGPDVPGDIMDAVAPQPKVLVRPVGRVENTRRGVAGAMRPDVDVVQLLVGPLDLDAPLGSRTNRLTVRGEMANDDNAGQAVDPARTASSTAPDARPETRLSVEHRRDTDQPGSFWRRMGHRALRVLDGWGVLPEVSARAAEPPRSILPDPDHSPADRSAYQALNDWWLSGPQTLTHRQWWKLVRSFPGLVALPTHHLRYEKARRTTPAQWVHRANLYYLAEILADPQYPSRSRIRSLVSALDDVREWLTPDGRLQVRLLGHNLGGMGAIAVGEDVDLADSIECWVITQPMGSNGLLRAAARAVLDLAGPDRPGSIILYFRAESVEPDSPKVLPASPLAGSVLRNDQIGAPHISAAIAGMIAESVFEDLKSIPLTRAAYRDGGGYPNPVITVRGVDYGGRAAARLVSDRARIAELRVPGQYIAVPPDSVIDRVGRSDPAPDRAGHAPGGSPLSEARNAVSERLAGYPQLPLALLLRELSDRRVVASSVLTHDDLREISGSRLAELLGGRWCEVNTGAGVGERFDGLMARDRIAETMEDGWTAVIAATHGEQGAELSFATKSKQTWVTEVTWEERSHHQEYIDPPEWRGPYRLDAPTSETVAVHVLFFDAAGRRVVPSSAAFRVGPESVPHGPLRGIVVRRDETPTEHAWIRNLSVLSSHTTSDNLEAALALAFAEGIPGGESDVGLYRAHIAAADDMRIAYDRSGLVAAFGLTERGELTTEWPEDGGRKLHLLLFVRAGADDTAREILDGASMQAFAEGSDWIVVEYSSEHEIRYRFCLNNGFEPVVDCDWPGLRRRAGTLSPEGVERFGVRADEVAELQSRADEDGAPRYVRLVGEAERVATGDITAVRNPDDGALVVDRGEETPELSDRALVLRLAPHELPRVMHSGGTTAAAADSSGDDPSGGDTRDGGVQDADVVEHDTAPDTGSDVAGEDPTDGVAQFISPENVPASSSWWAGIGERLIGWVVGSGIVPKGTAAAASPRSDPDDRSADSADAPGAFEANESDSSLNKLSDGWVVIGPERRYVPSPKVAADLAERRRRIEEVAAERRAAFAEAVRAARESPLGTDLPLAIAASDANARELRRRVDYAKYDEVREVREKLEEFFRVRTQEALLQARAEAVAANDVQATQGGYRVLDDGEAQTGGANSGRARVVGSAPDHLDPQLRAEFAQNGVRVAYLRTRFDAEGRVWLADLRAPDFRNPRLRAEAARIRLRAEAAQIRGAEKAAYRLDKKNRRWWGDVTAPEAEARLVSDGRRPGRPEPGWPTFGSVVLSRAGVVEYWGGPGHFNSSVALDRIDGIHGTLDQDRHLSVELLTGHEMPPNLEIFRDMMGVFGDRVREISLGLNASDSGAPNFFYKTAVNAAAGILRRDRSLSPERLAMDAVKRTSFANFVARIGFKEVSVRDLKADGDRRFSGQVTFKIPERAYRKKILEKSATREAVLRAYTYMRGNGKWGMVTGGRWPSAAVDSINSMCDEVMEPLPEPIELICRVDERSAESFESGVYPDFISASSGPEGQADRAHLRGVIHLNVSRGTPAAYLKQDRHSVVLLARKLSLTETERTNVNGEWHVYIDVRKPGPDETPPQASWFQDQGKPAADSASALAETAPAEPAIGSDDESGVADSEVATGTSPVGGRRGDNTNLTAPPYVPDRALPEETSDISVDGHHPEAPQPAGEQPSSEVPRGDSDGDNRDHVVVVGAGGRGLTAALVLRLNGYRVTIIAKDQPFDTVSAFGAAGVWDVTTIEDSELEMYWAILSFLVFRQMAQNPATGVYMGTGIFLQRFEGESTPWMTYLKDLIDARPATADELPPGAVYGEVGTVPIFNMPIYLKFLWDQCIAHGVEFEWRYLSTLDEVGHDASPIIAATGLGSGALLGDPDMYPIAGLRVTLKIPADLDIPDWMFDDANPDGVCYMIRRKGAVVMPDGTVLPSDSVTTRSDGSMVMPDGTVFTPDSITTRSDGSMVMPDGTVFTPDTIVVGGTYENGNSNTQPDPGDVVRMLRRVYQLQPKLMGHEIVDIRIGLRPAREGGARSDEIRGPGGRRVLLDYGNGGTGILTSLGAALYNLGRIGLIEGKVKLPGEVPTAAGAATDPPTHFRGPFTAGPPSSTSQAQPFDASGAYFFAMGRGFTPITFFSNPRAPKYHGPPSADVDPAPEPRAGQGGSGSEPPVAGESPSECAGFATAEVDERHSDYGPDLRQLGSNENESATAAPVYAGSDESLHGKTDGGTLAIGHIDSPGIDPASAPDVGSEVLRHSNVGDGLSADKPFDPGPTGGEPQPNTPWLPPLVDAGSVCVTRHLTIEPGDRSGTAAAAHALRTGLAGMPDELADAGDRLLPALVTRGLERTTGEVMVMVQRFVRAATEVVGVGVFDTSLQGAPSLREWATSTFPMFGRCNFAMLRPSDAEWVRGLRKAIWFELDVGFFELSPEATELRFGIHRNDQVKIQRAATARRIIIDVRPVNPYGLKWINSGIVLPKPSSVINKTITELDVELGADPENLGLVGCFAPALPAHWEALPHHLRDQKLEKRYRVRLEEWQLGKSTLDIDRGCVWGIGDDDRRRPYGPDNDLGALRNLDGSLITSQSVYEGHIETLKRYSNIRVMHGAVAHWIPPESQEDLQQELLEPHVPGGEPLVRFEPGRRPRAVWFDETPVRISSL